MSYLVGYPRTVRCCQVKWFPEVQQKGNLVSLFHASFVHFSLLFLFMAQPPAVTHLEKRRSDLMSTSAHLPQRRVSLTVAWTGGYRRISNFLRMGMKAQLPLFPLHNCTQLVYQAGFMSVPGSLQGEVTCGIKNTHIVISYMFNILI